MSAVDTETERHLVENLRPALAGRTVLIATPAPLDGRCVADRAVVLDDGRIVEDGRAGRPARGAAAPSPRSSETRPLPRKPHAPASRASGATPTGRQRRLAVVIAARRRRRPPRRSPAGISSGDAIDNGIRAGDEQRLTLDVVAYVGVDVAAWVLGTATLARGSRASASGSCSSSAATSSSTSRRSRCATSPQQKAGWIIARLTSDVDALSDVLNQGLTTLVVNTLTLVAAVGGLFLLDWRLGLVALLRPAARASSSRAGSSAPRTSPFVGRADADRRRHRAARRVGRRDGGRAGVQPRARVPARVRRAERGRTASRTSTRRSSPRSSSRRSSSSASIATVRRALRRRAADRRRLAGDRHADRRRRPAAARLPAAAGALRALRPGAGGERGDGEDLDGPRRRARHRRPARRARRSAGSTADLELDDVVFAYGDGAGAPRHLDRRPAPAAASRSSASRAAASRRPRS